MILKTGKDFIKNIGKKVEISNNRGEETIGVIYEESNKFFILHNHIEFFHGGQPREMLKGYEHGWFLGKGLAFNYIGIDEIVSLKEDNFKFISK